MDNYNGKAYAYTAIGLLVAGVVFLGLMFSPLGIYALIAAVLLNLAALSFINLQKKKNNFEKLKIIRIIAYVLLGVSLAVFIGGMIWAAVN